MDLEPLVTFLVTQPTAIRRLLAQHRDAGDGSCLACRIGAQRGHLSWPCTIYTAALAANMRTATNLVDFLPQVSRRLAEP